MALRLRRIRKAIVAFLHLPKAPIGLSGALGTVFRMVGKSQAQSKNTAVAAMHVRELVELAGLASQHGPTLIVGPHAIDCAGLQLYWSSSKCRLDRWSRAIKTYQSVTPAGKLESAIRWGAIRPVLEEILVSEILTRVWTGVLCGYDRARSLCEAQPIADSVLRGHLEARSRALAILVDSPHVDAEEAVLLNRLRRRAERWTDLLLAALVDHIEVKPLAFDLSRVCDFAEDLNFQRKEPGGRHTWSLTMVALRGAFQSGLCENSPNADIHLRVAGGILGCFSADLFDSTGLLRSMWLVRMATSTSDVQGMIDELLCDDEPSIAEPETGAPGSFERPPARPKRFG